MNKEKNSIKLNMVFGGKIVPRKAGQSCIAGFTLVEMLVAISIFIIVITIIIGIFVNAVRVQKQNLAYQELLDQTSYVMEYMSRAIRMAMKDDIKIWGYDDTTNCLTGDKVNYEFDAANQCLIFRNYRNECQFFCLQGTVLVTTTTVSGVVPTSFINLTSSSSLQVYPLAAQWIQLSGEAQTDGAGDPDTDQPLVHIGLRIEGREETRIRIQTSISQRNLDTQK